MPDINSGYHLDEMKTNFRAIFTREINVLHDKGTAASKEFLIHLSQDSNFPNY